jgi:hypothetical protein
MDRLARKTRTAKSYKRRERAAKAGVQAVADHISWLNARVSDREDPEFHPIVKGDRPLEFFYCSEDCAVDVIAPDHGRCVLAELLGRRASTPASRVVALFEVRHSMSFGL